MLLQRRQIVIKAVGNQIDIEDIVGSKYAAITFHSIAWISISINVTIYGTDTPTQSCQSSHFIIATKLRSSIEAYDHY